MYKNGTYQSPEYFFLESSQLQFDNAMGYGLGFQSLPQHLIVVHSERFCFQ